MLIIPHDPFTPTVKNHFSPRLTISALSPLKSGDYRTTRAWTDFCLSPSNFLPLTLSFSLFPPRSIIPSSLEHCLLPNQLSSVILFLFLLPPPTPSLPPQREHAGNFCFFSSSSSSFSFFQRPRHQASAWRELAVWQAEFSKSRDAISDSCLPRKRRRVCELCTLSLSLSLSPRFFLCQCRCPCLSSRTFSETDFASLGSHGCASSWDFRRYVVCSRPPATIRL